MKRKRKFNTISTCLYCGIIFQTYTWEFKLGRGKYCSRSCLGKAKLPHVIRKGSDNPNWKNGVSKNNYHYKKIQKERYPEKIKTREKTYYAIKTGKLIKQPCEVCGEINVHAHHDDYSKPFEVRWLCRKHHRELTGNLY